MRAIFINAAARTISEVDTDGKLASIYAAIGCNLIEVGGRFTNGDVLYVDEEGLLNAENGFTFAFDGAMMESRFQEFLAGNGIILGEDREGETSGAVSDVKSLRRLVKFFAA